MARLNFNKIPDADKADIFREISRHTGMSAFAVEKDWWVVQTLSIVFKMDVAKYLVFKGGTSLSKAWKLIDRFSEDIDLSIDRSFFKMSGELTRSKQSELRKKAGHFTSTSFFTDLKSAFANKEYEVSFDLIDYKDSDQDPRIIEVYYPNVITAPGYLAPKVQIEIGCRSLREPFTNQSFRSLVDDEYPDSDFAQPHIIVPTVNPERTFLEKIFLLHEEFGKPAEKVRVNRLSRHLYDIVKLSKTEFASKALSDQNLYKTIVDHRYKFTRVGGVDYNKHQPESISPIPTTEIIELWRSDYNIMLEQMIYETGPPSFDEIMSDLLELKHTINNLSWKIDKVYPIPIK